MLNDFLTSGYELFLSNQTGSMESYVFDLREIDSTFISVAGGKGANLGELMKIEGINVPDGFCVGADAFKRIVTDTPVIDELLDKLSGLRVEDRERINVLSAQLRKTIEEAAIPGDIIEEISRFLAEAGAECAWAVRSSATAEDLPSASFAGQQDTYLNITGTAEVLKHISMCQASLFTDRAIIYRIQNGFDHRKVCLAVVVQQMVFPEVSGILFTADPVTGNRKVVSIDAGFGLGEALVSGRVNADNYKVRDDTITETRISTRKLAIYALKDGGTKPQEIAPELQNRQALTDEHILELAVAGRKIEAHFGCPQDIEWCMADDTFYIVQSRPITTLFPIPKVNDEDRHVYLSVGHQQMMTDPMKPLGLSMWQMTALRPMYEAGGRLFVDIAQQMASPEHSKALIDMLGQHDPLIKDALMTLIERADFIQQKPVNKEKLNAATISKSKPAADFQTPMEIDLVIVAELIQQNQASLKVLQRDIATKPGAELFDFIKEDIRQMQKRLTDPRSSRAVSTGMEAYAWVNEKMNEWLGEKNTADILSQSVPNNITSEMGLALLDVADAIRPYPKVIEYLQEVTGDHFQDELVKLPGGQESWEAVSAYLGKYGMRCAGEIDITKTRWSENPITLWPLILNNIKNFLPGEGKRRFEQGLQDALKKEQNLLERLYQLPEGVQKAEETKQMISLLRNFIGYREYPKYGIVSRFFFYKQALMGVGEQLVQAGVIDDKEDIYYLTFEELNEVVCTNKLYYRVPGKRKDEFRSYEQLSPPRVITSDGEIITGRYNRDNLPAGAIAGLAVSSGIIEGRARVILNMEDAELEDGDILVTTFTDPGWTTLFVSIVVRQK